jgi:hypothetical protein
MRGPSRGSPSMCTRLQTPSRPRITRRRSCLSSVHSPATRYRCARSEPRAALAVSPMLGNSQLFLLHREDRVQAWPPIDLIRLDPQRRNSDCGNADRGCVCLPVLDLLGHVLPVSLDEGSERALSAGGLFASHAYRLSDNTEKFSQRVSEQPDIAGFWCVEAELANNSVGCLVIIVGLFGG